MKRLGRQTPTKSFIIPYDRSRGQEAIDLYNKAKNKLLDWQDSLLKDIMAVNHENLWTHQKFGYSVSRRNGKSEDVLAFCLWGLKVGIRILYTAHRTSTTHKIWDRLMKLCEDVKIDTTSTMKAFGKEHIYTASGGAIEFRTRTSSGGLGEGYDALIIDEAQEYTEAQETALKYVVSDAPNPITIFLGTPPTTVSVGTVFMKMRDVALSGKGFDTGWAEWSVDDMTDPEDVDAWYETNPSLGTILTERKIRSEITNDPIDFNIQRLGLWLKYNQKSAISEAEWKALKVEELPEFTGPLHVGIKYGQADHVAMSLAVKTEDGRIFVEGIDCRPIRDGNDWILSTLSLLDYETVTVDGANGQGVLKEDMDDAGLGEPLLPTVNEVITAHAKFEQNLYNDVLCHADQPSLTQVVSNCEKRSIGSRGGFGYRSIKTGVDICLMDSMVLAQWACGEAKEEVSIQRISY